MLIVVARIQNCCPCMPYPFTWFLTNRNESFTKPYLPTCYYNSSQMWIVRRGVLPLRTHGFLFIWAPGSPLPGGPFLWRRKILRLHFFDEHRAQLCTIKCAPQQQNRLTDV